MGGTIPQGTSRRDAPSMSTYPPVVPSPYGPDCMTCGGYGGEQLTIPGEPQFKECKDCHGTGCTSVPWAELFKGKRVGP